MGALAAERHCQHAFAGRSRDRARGHQSRAAPAHGRLRRARREAAEHPVEGQLHDRSAGRAGRRRLRGGRDLDWRLRQHAPRRGDSGAARYPAECRRRGPRGREPHPAQRAGDGRHRARHGGDLPRRVAAQPHQLHDAARTRDHARDVGENGRAVPRGDDLPLLPLDVAGRELPRPRADDRRREPPPDHDQAHGGRRRRRPRPSARVDQRAAVRARRAASLRAAGRSRARPQAERRRRVDQGGSARGEQGEDRAVRTVRGAARVERSSPVRVLPRLPHRGVGLG